MALNAKTDSNYVPERINGKFAPGWSGPSRTNPLPDPFRQTLARRREQGTYRIGARTTPP
jgi:hypothetical protein